MTNQESMLVLNAVPGMTGRLIGRLLNTFGSFESILHQSEDSLLDQGLNRNLVTNIVHFPKDKFLQAEYNDLRKIGASFITREDVDYPPLLKEIKDAPLVLYIKGDKQLLDKPAIALVGSRNATGYGRKIAEQFSSYFAQAGVLVVSGLAYGIDTVSHQSVLKSGGITVAVLGAGLNHIYPKENLFLSEEISRKGLLMSEFPLNTAPLAYNFPRRNRIISGLSLATVVVEATEKSGALITADYAIEQGRDVFAVPGPIDGGFSQGTNKLIRDGARIALSPMDVLEEIGIEIKKQLILEQKDDPAKTVLSEEEFSIYQLITETPQHVDAIFSRSEDDVGGLMSLVLNLELKGLIKQLPGHFYIRSNSLQ